MMVKSEIKPKCIPEISCSANTPLENIAMLQYITPPKNFGHQRQMASFKYILLEELEEYEQNWKRKEGGPPSTADIIVWWIKTWAKYAMVKSLA
jgi:hypothetical protein